MSRRIVGGHVGADILVADARHLPFPAGTFDVVIAFHVISHMLQEDRKKIASESARLLRRGGQLLFRGFSVEDMRAGSGAIVEEGTSRRGAGILTHYFTDKEVLLLFDTLMPETIHIHRWMMRVRGRDLARAEVTAVFSKPD